MLISEYWSKVRHTTNGWMHPDDEEVFARCHHTFNLDYPPPAFVGDVLKAKVVVLAANGGYHPERTPTEFPDDSAFKRYLQRLADPSSARWTEVAHYYDKLNYAEHIDSGTLVLVNACAYRSRKISEEPENQRAARQLPSVAFQRRWLIEQILPDAERGTRLIVGKRHGLWQLPDEVKASAGFIADPAPVSPHLSRVVLDRLLPLIS